MHSADDDDDAAAAATATSHMTSNASILQSPRYQAISPQLTTDAQHVIDIINQQEKKNFKLGVLFIAVAIISWMLGLQLVNSVLKGDDYNKPFCLAVITGGCFSLNLIPEVWHWIKSPTSISHQSIPKNNESTPLLSQNLELHHSASLPLPAQQLQHDYDSEKASQELTSREITILALQLTIIYYTYNVLGMASLQYTLASNQTVLGSTTAIFTLFIGRLLKLDLFSTKKIFCVIISLLGVVFINISQHGPDDNQTNDHDHNKYQPKNPPLGNTFALLAAFCYALYLILMKLKCGSGTKTTNERQLFGIMGLFTLLLGIPTLFLVHILQIETFEFPPPNNTILIMILLNSFLSYISDFVTILAMLLTSPLVTSLALTSSIPITIFTDYLILHFTNGDKSPSSLNLYIYTGGILSILVSVVLINVDIVSENEYIEDVIEDALESAIRHDEVLSPILSPLLESLSTHPHHQQSSPSVKSIGFGFLASPRFMHLKPTPASTPKKQLPQLTRKISQFRLDSGNDDDNHLIGPIPTLDLVQNLNLSALTAPANMLVYGGINHQYRVAHVNYQAPSSASPSPAINSVYDQTLAKSPHSLN